MRDENVRDLLRTVNLVNTIDLIRPDGRHAHFRDGAVLADVVPASAARLARAPERSGICFES